MKLILILLITVILVGCTGVPYENSPPMKGNIGVEESSPIQGEVVAEEVVVEEHTCGGNHEKEPGHVCKKLTDPNHVCDHAEEKVEETCPRGIVGDTVERCYLYEDEDANHVCDLSE